MKRVALLLLAVVMVAWLAGCGGGGDGDGGSGPDAPVDVNGHWIETETLVSNSCNFNVPSTSVVGITFVQDGTWLQGSSDDGEITASGSIDTLTGDFSLVYSKSEQGITAVMNASGKFTSNDEGYCTSIYDVHVSGRSCQIRTTSTLRRG